MRLLIIPFLCLLTFSPLNLSANAADRPDVLIADFEQPTYGNWEVEGEAFGTGPAQGTLPGQMHVGGYHGKGLVNSFKNGDRTTGKLTSPEFKLQRPWINFLIGGGAHEGQTCMNLLIDGTIVLSATGPNANAGGSEELEQQSWDVSEWSGKAATIQIVDQHNGGWGHINVDQIVLSDTKAGPTLVELQKELLVNNSHLIVPVGNRGKQQLLEIYQGDRLVQNFNVVLPEQGAPSWLAAYPLSHFQLNGQKIQLRFSGSRRQPETLSEAFHTIHIGTAQEARQKGDYSQPYRDQFHVTTRRGWNNDPNGMVYHDGKYHLYYQHNPFGIGWGNMHWGHFVSTDLLHWEELPLALFQNTVGDYMFSGGGFVDSRNTSGLGQNTMFVAFTSTGRGECQAFSQDGGLTFQELEQNPVVKHRGRDPKVIWYEPEQKWVMVLYDSDECAETQSTPPAGGNDHHNMAFWESRDLRKWTRTGAFTDPDRSAVFECPEMFELTLAGQPEVKKWILYGAQNRYFIGSFDGKTFHKESGPHGNSRGALYAAQAFSDTPDGRRIQIGWIRNQPFLNQYPDQIVSQSFSLPQELTLRETEHGLRMFYQPVQEVQQLRAEAVTVNGTDLSGLETQGSEVLIEFEKSQRHELILNGISMHFEGKQAKIFVDRTFCEVYVDHGLEYSAFSRRPEDLETNTNAVISDSHITSLKVFRLKSIWK